jgi:hypothetical protein
MFEPLRSSLSAIADCDCVPRCRSVSSTPNCPGVRPAEAVCRASSLATESVARISLM